MNDMDVTTIEKCLGWSGFAELLEDKLVTSPQNQRNCRRAECAGGQDAAAPDVEQPGMSRP
jgi:hypothetical protein